MKTFVILFISLTSLVILVTGGIAFFQPFSNLNARLHIIFGLVFTCLAVWHVFQQRKGFLKHLKKKKIKAITWACGLFTLLLYISWMNIGLIQKMMSYSYEESHKTEIFRAHPKTTYQNLSEGIKVKRSDENVDAYLEIEFWDDLNYDDLAISIWVEDDRGRLIETLYLSPQLAYQEKFNFQGYVVSRRLLLPVWWYKWQEMIKEQQKSADDLMALSSASIYGSFSLNTTIKEGLSNFRLCMEINQVDDENELYRQDSKNFMARSPKGIGQPSVLYSSYLDLHEQHRNEYSLLEYYGHSDVAGEDGELTRSHSGLSTSLKILRKALLRVSIH